MAKVAWFKRILTLTVKPTGAVGQRLFVNGDGNPIGANTRAFGISTDEHTAQDVTDGNKLTVTIQGIEELRIGAAVAKDAYLTSDSAARGVTATTGQLVNARALEAGSAADEVIPALLLNGPTIAP